MTELTDNDRQRAKDFATQLGWDEEGTAERNDIIKAFEAATIFERQQQIGMASEAYAAGLYRASNADDSESFEDFRRRKNLMTKQVVEAERTENADLLAKVSEQEKEIALLNKHILEWQDKSSEQREEIENLRDHDKLLSKIKSLHRFKKLWPDYVKKIEALLSPPRPKE